MACVIGVLWYRMLFIQWSPKCEEDKELTPCQSWETKLICKTTNNGLYSQRDTINGCSFFSIHFKLKSELIMNDSADARWQMNNSNKKNHRLHCLASNNGFTYMQTLCDAVSFDKIPVAISRTHSCASTTDTHTSNNTC